MSVRKIKSLREIEPWLHALPDAWLVLDIDETLVTTKEFRGCEKWYEERVRHYEALGPEASVQKANEEWENVHLQTPVVCVEDSLPLWVASFQKARPTIAATARSAGFAERTRAQLKEVGLEFQPFQQNQELSHSASYQNGILFVGALGDKGLSLKELFLSMGKPKSVVMVDDKIHHLESSKAKLSDLGVEFQGGHIQSSPWVSA